MSETAAPEIELPILIPPEDHDAGFTFLPVKARSGLDTFIKLIAPPARVAAKLQQRLMREGDFDLTAELIRLCVPEEQLAILDKLDVDDISKVALACQQLAFGVETQKKILRLALRLQAKPPDTGSESSAPNASASAPAGPVETLSDGASPG
jgi:hypothetical protein